MTSKWPSEVPFAPLLVYSPRGQAEISQRSRNACYGIKRCDGRFIGRAIELLSEAFVTHGLDEFLGPEVGLVPAPRSSPRVAGALWPADSIARALVESGYGKLVLNHLQRASAVPKSSSADHGQRPEVERHYETITVEGDLVTPQRLTIVDDVITKGRTLYACAARLTQVFPDADIRCLAIVRTMGFLPEVEEVVAPCTGRIVWDGKDVRREP